MANPALSSKTPAAMGLNEKLKSYLEMDETELPPEFRPTLKVLKEQIAAYLAGDTSMMFDSVELHMIQTYFAGKRQGLDGTTIEGSFDFIEILCRKSLETQEWLKKTAGTVFRDASVSHRVPVEAANGPVNKGRFLRQAGQVHYRQRRRNTMRGHRQGAHRGRWASRRS